MNGAALGSRTDTYLLSISVNPPAQWRGALAGLLIPLTDGLVSAVHAHTGPIDAVVSRTAGHRPDITAQTHLAEPALGTVGASAIR